MPTHQDVHPALQSLIDIALDECIRAKKNAVEKFPFLLTNGTNGMSMSPVNEGDERKPLSEALASARQRIRDQEDVLETYVIAWDGNLKLKDGVSAEGFVLEAGERAQEQGFCFFQGYKDESGNITLMFGNGGLLRRTEQLLK